MEIILRVGRNVWLVPGSGRQGVDDVDVNTAKGELFWNKYYLQVASIGNLTSVER
jgi:hypothetical protein